ncbi:unnamed protein product [Rhodiola kirilowii]
MTKSKPKHMESPLTRPIKVACWRIRSDSDLSEASFTGCERRQRCLMFARVVKPRTFDFLSCKLLSGRSLIVRHSCSKLFVGGLSYDTNEPVLKDAFEEFGELIEVKVICDHKSGKSKGYGFVNYTSETSANTALKQMDGKSLDGRNIRVHYAHKG